MSEERKEEREEGSGPLLERGRGAEGSQVQSGEQVQRRGMVLPGWREGRVLLLKRERWRKGRYRK